MQKCPEIIAVALLFFLFSSCKKRDSVVPENSATPSLSANSENNSAIASLGRVLFYDKKLSHNKSISCASCHQQSRAFCDNEKQSPGLQGVMTRRNTPSIFSKTGRLFWDGRAEGIHDLVLRPVKDHVEMGIKDFGQLVDRINNTSYYPGLFKQAFDEPIADSARINAALVEFLQGFVFANSKFSRSEKGSGELSASERLGKDLFFGRAKCTSCHRVTGVVPDPNGQGGYGSPDVDMFAGHNIGLDEVYADNGIGEVTGSEKDNGKFMVPALMNVEYTYPYMHDGRFNTLEEVVEHYSTGIKDHPNLDLELRDLSKLEVNGHASAMAVIDVNGNGMVDKEESHLAPPVRLNLSIAEKRHLVEFLKTLSDPGIKTDKRFSDPFQPE